MTLCFPPLALPELTPASKGHVNCHNTVTRFGDRCKLCLVRNHPPEPVNTPKSLGP